MDRPKKKIMVWIFF